MGNARTTLPAYGRIKPYRQGELSNLCGIYAPLNAARLLVPDRAEERQLWADAYTLAVKRLSTHRKLTQGMVRGLTYETWKVLQHVLYDELSANLGVDLHMRPLVRRSVTPGHDLSQELCKAIDANRAVLCALCGPHNHFTVIAGYTPTRWLLHDSAGLRWVDRSSTAIGRPQGRLHWMPFSSLVMLYRKEQAA